MTPKVLVLAAATLLGAAGGSAHALPQSTAPLPFSLLDERAGAEPAGCGYSYGCTTDFRTGKRYCYMACLDRPKLNF